MGVPVVDHAWWQRLCRGWAAPLVERCVDRHPAALIRRTVRLLRTAADAPAAVAVLGRLNVTLLHGDVHPGNIIGGDREARLIDWGSARIGPPMLDLANVTEPGSPGFAAYRTAWEQRPATRSIRSRSTSATTGRRCRSRSSIPPGTARTTS